MDALEQIVRGGYQVGGRGSSDEAITFCAHRGWQRWLGRSHAMTPEGLVRTPDDDDGIFGLPVSLELDLTDDLICDWRHGDCW